MTYRRQRKYEKFSNPFLVTTKKNGEDKSQSYSKMQ